MTSRNPSVVIKAVLAPFRSIKAFVAKVVPCITCVKSLSAIPASKHTTSIPSIIAATGFSLLVRTLVE